MSTVPHKTHWSLSSEFETVLVKPTFINSSSHCSFDIMHVTESWEISLMSTSAREGVCAFEFTKKRGVIRQHVESSVAKKMPFHSFVWEKGIHIVMRSIFAKWWTNKKQDCNPFGLLALSLGNTGLKINSLVLYREWSYSQQPVNLS